MYVEWEDIHKVLQRFSDPYDFDSGAKRSQPFVMLFHSTVAIGFFLGPVILGPFFPENEDDNQKNDICNGTSAKSDRSDTSNVDEVIESIKWAYWIMLIGHILCAIGYLAIYFSPAFKMPGNTKTTFVY